MAEMLSILILKFAVLQHLDKTFLKKKIKKKKPL